MAKTKKKMRMTNLVCTIVLLATLVGVIIGLFIDYFGITGSVSSGLVGSGSSHTEYAKLFDMEETWGTLSIIAAIATAVFCALGLVLSVLKNMGGKKFGSLQMIVGVVTVLLAIFAVVCVFIYGSDYSASADGGDLVQMSVTVAPAVGAWLLAVCGVINGVACVMDR